jgi:hypothetical protein
MFALVLAVALAAPGAGDRFDELWARRDSPGAVKELQAIADQELAAAPASYQANLREAELLNWRADSRDIDSDEKARLARKAWEAAEKALQAKPDDARAHYHAAIGIGLYAEGAGMITALRQGLEGKFRDHIQAAMRLDPNYQDGGPEVVWGRYFFRLPWPKRDVDQATRILTDAVRKHPQNLRAKLFLADCYADKDKVDEGKALVQQVLSAPPGRDGPDDRKVRAQAKDWLEAHGPPNTAQ